MRLVDQHEIGLLHVIGFPVYRLDTGEQNACTDIALVEPGRVDAGRRLRPKLQELGSVLADQFPYMGDNENPLVRPLFQDLADEGGHDQRLAAGRGDNDDRVTGLLSEIAVDSVDRCALIGPEPDHGAASPRSGFTPLTQLLPSRMRYSTQSSPASTTSPGTRSGI
jgi:hypothetical protein